MENITDAGDESQKEMKKDERTDVTPVPYSNNKVEEVDPEVERKRKR